MTNRLFALTLAVLFAVFVLAVNAGAQETKPEALPETKPSMSVEDVKKSLEEIKNYLGMELLCEE